MAILVSPTIRTIDVRRDGDRKLLERAYHEIYEPAFPVDAEREALAEWERSLASTEPFQRQPRRHVHVATSAGDDPIGIVVGERYAATGLISYIAVSPVARRSGVGRELMNRVIDSLKAAEGAEDRLRGVFAEVHDPMLVSSDEPIDPVQRLVFMKKCGAKVVPVRYVQPGLSKGQEPVENLWLIALPCDGPLGHTMPSEVVRNFVEDLYDALGASNDASKRALENMMLDASEPVIELLDLEFRTEDPVLQFERYGIAIHFALERVRKPGIALRRRRRKPSLPPASVHLDSWEQDMLAYAYRAPPPPLRTTLLAPPKGQRSVDMILPPALSYRSEGRQVVLSAPPAPPGSPAERRRRLEVRVAQTTFARSGMAVLHVILVPGTPLDEYDLIKLSKVWEGGEGLPRPGEPQVWLKFRPGNATGTRRNNDAEGLVFKELAAQMAGGREFRSPQGSNATFRVGTIQLLPDELVSAPSASWWRELIDDMKSVKESPSKFASEHPAGSPRHRRVLALGGIMQGLLDFPAVDATELSDVFAEFGEYGELPLGFHKGTLLHVAPSDRPWKATQDYLGVSPYLLVTHGILLHNEERLKHADRLSVAISRGARRWSRPWATRAGRLRSVRADMVTALDEMVPNVMHYGQERWIYDKGRTSRGLQELEDQVEAELRHAAVTIDARVNYDLALASGLVGIIATAIAFLPVPKWLIPVLVAAVAIGYVVFVKVRARPSSASDPRVGRHS